MPTSQPDITRIDEWLFSKVDQILVEVIADSVSKLSDAIYPVVGVCLSIWVVLYAWAIMRGVIDEPATDFIHRAGKISVVSSIVFSGGVYATDIVNVLVSLPDDLSAAIFGSPGINGVVSEILEALMIPTKQLGASLSLFAVGESIYRIVTILVMVGCAAILSVMSSLVLITVKVGMALLVCVGPIFITAILFESTKELFSRWVSQLINYTILGLLFTLLFRVVMGINLALVKASTNWIDGNDVQMAAVIFAYIFVFGASVYIFLQLPTIASGLSGGFGLQFSTPGRMIRQAISGRR